jgi:hypothetical protein
MSRATQLSLVLSLVTAVAAGACGSTSNRRPVAVDQQATTDEDVAVDIKVLDADRDPDGDSLTVTGAAVIGNTAGHRVEVVDGTLVRLTPAKDYSGTIELSYDISDRTTSEVTGHVTVTVKPVNDAPVAAGGSRDLHGSHAVMLEASDVDHDALSFEVTSNPGHGTLTGNAPDLIYTPAPGFTGDDAISYRVSDGKLNSQPAVLELHVSPGAAPIAVNANVTTPENGEVAIRLLGIDADGDVLTFELLAAPAHGTLAGTPPNLVYTPEAKFHGDDAIEFTVSDGLLTSTKAQIALHVTSVNDAPVATPQAQAASEDTDLTITLAGSDADRDPLSFQIKDRPMHGTLSAVAGATVTYTPEPDYHGPDHFTFVAFDGELTSAPAAVDLQVAAADDPPVAMALTRTLAEDTPASITLVGSDVDGDPLQFAIADRPAHGTLSGDPPNVTFTPDADFNRDDAFTYTVSDGTITSAPATVTLHVTPVNDRPIAVDGAVTTDEDTATAIALQASDVDGDPLSFAILSAPADGSLTGSGASWTYTPARNVSGTRRVTFRVSDGSLTADATVTITIAPLNDPPVATDDFAATDPDSALTFDVTGNDGDIDGDSLALDTVDPPAHGTAAVVDGKVLYTPAAGFTGLEDFGYTVIDRHGGSARGTVHLGVGSFPAGAPTETIASNGSGASISRDGRYLAFSTTLPLVAEDTHNGIDIYIYDRGTRTLALASVDSAGHPGNGDSTRPRLSGDGRYVVFQSTATNLVPGDTGFHSDVFRHDRATGETVRISVAADGSEGNGESFEAEISGDGNLVVFTSMSFNLVGNDANGTSDVFLRNVSAGTTDRISVSISGGDVDLASSQPVINNDGRFVAFTSRGTNLVTLDTNGLSDVFVRDLTAGATTRVSVTTAGAQSTGAATTALMSRDARFIAFTSTARDLVPGGVSGLYVRDLQQLTTTQPANVVSTTGARLSGDGRFVVSYDSFSGTTEIADRFSSHGVRLSVFVASPAISDNVKYIVGSDVSGRLIVTPNPLSP